MNINCVSFSFTKRNRIAILRRYRRPHRNHRNCCWSQHSNLPKVFQIKFCKLNFVFYGWRAVYNWPNRIAVIHSTEIHLCWCCCCWHIRSMEMDIAFGYGIEIGLVSVVCCHVHCKSINRNWTCWSTLIQHENPRIIVMCICVGVEHWPWHCHRSCQQRTRHTIEETFSAFSMTRKCFRY